MNMRCWTDKEYAEAQRLHDKFLAALRHKCTADLYRFGSTEGVYAMTKEQAEAYCQKLRDDGFRADWYFSGGRVVVKALPGDEYVMALSSSDLEQLHEHAGSMSEDLAKRIESLWIDMTTEE